MVDKKLTIKEAMGVARAALDGSDAFAYFIIALPEDEGPVESSIKGSLEILALMSFQIQSFVLGTISAKTMVQKIDDGADEKSEQHIEGYR